MELDHDVSPHGQREGQPDGHRVDHQGEVHVEEDDQAPNISQLQNYKYLHIGKHALFKEVNQSYFDQCFM